MEDVVRFTGSSASDAGGAAAIFNFARIIINIKAESRCSESSLPLPRVMKLFNFTRQITPL